MIQYVKIHYNDISIISLECKKKLVNWYHKLGCHNVSILPSVYNNIGNTKFYLMIYKYKNININIYEYWNDFRCSFWKIKLLQKFEEYEYWSD